MSLSNRNANNPAQNHPVSLSTIVGSASLWAWGWLAYLSPSLFPGRESLESVGLETGFFVSQATVVLVALGLFWVSKKHAIRLGRWTLFGCALTLSFVSLAIPAFLERGNSGVVAVLSVLPGVADTFLGIAWGTRYTLGSRRAPTMIVLSFLLAYVFYFFVSMIPYRAITVGIVVLLPLASWGLWVQDAFKRHKVTSDVFPNEASAEGSYAMPGEMVAGSWEASVLPWRSLGIIVLASFIGNFASSVIMGESYRGAESLYLGGVIVCIVIALAAFFPFNSSEEIAVRKLYRVTITFTIAGLVCILALGSNGVIVGGVLMQGCAAFFQVLVFVLVVQSTQQEGLSPLLAFGLGQALISGVVLTGNLGGKLFLLLGDNALFFNVACGVGILALCVVLTNQTADSDLRTLPSLTATEEELEVSGVKVSEAGEPSEKTEEAAPLQASESQRIAQFSHTYKLTRREEEIFEYLIHGRTLPYIADTLYVTSGTVKTHVKHIYHKCCVNSRQELIDLFEEE